VELTAVRGPHGTIPVRVLNPKSGADEKKNGHVGAFMYFHGGGCTVGSVDEFENGWRLRAEGSGVQVGNIFMYTSHLFSSNIIPLDTSAYQAYQVYGIDYRLAPEFKFPTRLDEYSTIIDALQVTLAKAMVSIPTASAAAATLQTET
jgi:acetyl esterase/lipase